MKKPITILTAIFFIATLSSSATVYTVSNDPAGGAHYSSLITAISAAASGDTLLVEGTNINFSHIAGASFNKKLTIIGIGFRPDKVNPRRTRIASFNASGASTYFSVGSSACSGSGLYGIEFMNEVIFASGQTFTNIVFEDCRFNNRVNIGNVSVSNCIFKNCVFNYNTADQLLFGSTTANSNILFTNCIFTNTINGFSATVHSLTFDHCLFLASASAPLVDMRSATIKNSIFMNNASIESGTSANNTYLNNISRLGSLPTGSGSGGNISNTDPNFTTYTLGASYSEAHDYTLQSGSAAIGVANDGTDIGVHGGTAGFSETGEVLIVPIIRAMNVKSTSVSPGGNIQIQITAGKPYDN